jgi:hypothetical protein
MVEILKNFEQVGSRLSPPVLIVPGLLMTALGLFVWLGGLGLRRTVLALVGAVVGASLAFLVARQYAALLALSAMAMAFVGAVFQRFFTGLLLGMLGFAIAFVIVAWPLLQEHQGTLIAGNLAKSADERLTPRQSLDVVRATMFDLTDNVRYAAGRLAPVNWAIAAAAGVVPLTLGLVLQCLGGALSCSALGTMLIVAGLVLLTILKGSGPVARIESKASFYGIVFLVMAGFGTLEQLALCRRSKQRQETKPKGKRATPQSSKKGWRNR